MKVFRVDEFIDKLLWLVNDVPNYYYSKSGTWCNYNSSNGKFMMDCVVSIKGLLWGFKADKTKAHGGGIYGSNGVRDFSANGGINYCTDVSRDFNNLSVGEYLCMKDTQYSHAGIYIGNGKVFECTAGWNVNKCIISDITNKGERIYKGVKGVPWTYHGKLIYIDYDVPTPTPSLKYKVGDVVNINGVYVSSTSTEMKKPKITKGTITKIIAHARNPYLLDDGAIGWVNDNCIINTKYKYLNLSPTVSSWTVYKTNNYYIPTRESDVLIRLNPHKFNGLSYKILQDMGNYHFKIKTVNKGDGYIAGNPNKYACTITDKPIYENGCY